MMKNRLFWIGLIVCICIVAGGMTLFATGIDGKAAKSDTKELAKSQLLERMNLSNQVTKDSRGINVTEMTGAISPTPPAGKIHPSLGATQATRSVRPRDASLPVATHSVQAPDQRVQDLAFRVEELKSQGLFDAALWSEYFELTTPERTRPTHFDEGGETCADATVIAALPYSDTGNTCDNTDDYEEMDGLTDGCPYASTSPDVVYSYTPSSNEIIDIYLCDSGYDTKLWVYESATGNPADCQTANLLECDEDGCGASYRSRIDGLELTGGNTYFIVVDGYSGECGDYILDMDIGDQPAPLECPPNTIFGQNFVSGWAGTADILGAPYSSNYLRADNFSGVTQPICDIHWWGVRQIYDGDWAGCDEDPMVFNIYFMNDAMGVPGDTVCAYEGVTVSAWDTEQSWNDVTVQYYTLDLSAEPAGCCNLSEGWVGIQGAGVGDDCWFLWSEGTGDAVACQLAVDGVWEEETDYTNQAFCLTILGDVYGACCTEEEGVYTCTDNVLATECAGDNQEFFPNQLCADIYCGPPLGRCCAYDEFNVPQWCQDEVTEDECLNTLLGDEWTEGASCPCCYIECPPNGIPEGEPDCGPGYTDNYNAGCNNTPFNFTPIACGDTICGASGTYDDGSRDTDWYRLELTEYQLVTWNLIARFPSLIFIIDAGSEDCDDYEIIDSETAVECDTATLAYYLPAGVYWLWAGPSEYTGYPCVRPYIAWVTCEDPPTGACCYCDPQFAPGLSCTEGVNLEECLDMGGLYFYEGASCDTVCDFECVIDYTVTAPGTWNGNTCGAGNDCLYGGDSEDHTYAVTIPYDGEWTISLCGSSYDTYMLVGACCCSGDICENDDSELCGEASLQSACYCLDLTAGTYYVMIEGYSSADCGDYVLTVEECICEIVCEGIPEGEPDCYPDYVDVYNGGCNSDPPAFLPIECGQQYCGRSGTYDYQGSPYRDTDWYELVITDVMGPQTVTWCAYAEFDMDLFIIDGGSGDCTDYSLVTGAEGLRCDTTCVSACVPPGTYWLFIAPLGSPDCGIEAEYNVWVTCEPCVLPLCPENTWLAQPMTPEDGGWSFGVSDLGWPAGWNKRYAPFDYSGQWICDLHFWGLVLTPDFTACDENPMTFEIAFYDDNAGVPGNIVWMQNVTLTGTMTPFIYAGFNAYEYELFFDPCITEIPVWAAWLSIQGVSVGDPTDCVFLWASHGDDGAGYHLIEDAEGFTSDVIDLSFCLTYGEYENPCPQDTIVVKRIGNDIAVIGKATAGCYRVIYSTTDPNEPGPPPGGGWVIEAVFEVPYPGTWLWIDPNPWAASTIKYYQSIHYCVNMGGDIAGACHYGDPVQCVMTSAADCAVLGGTYDGAGTGCP